MCWPAGGRKPYMKRTHHSDRRGRLFCLIATSLLLICTADITSSAGQWIRKENGYWAYEENGSYLCNGWYWIDGNGDGIAECYYCSDNGSVYTQTHVDGWRVNADGAWVTNGVPETLQVEPWSWSPYAGGAVQWYTPAQETVITHYTPALARQMASPFDATGIPYFGRVWHLADYAGEQNDLVRDLNLKRCGFYLCPNPCMTGKNYCELHTCREKGCNEKVSESPYNAGYCPGHMIAHGIDAAAFAQQEAVEAAARAAAARASSGQKKRSSYSSGSTVKSDVGPGVTSSASVSKSGRDSYDEGYEDVMGHGEYDDVRYRRDWDYMLGVDDAMDELGEDW